MKANKILIIGGGIAGMCAAIELRKRGAQVDLVEIDPHWRASGAGITLSGPTLRAFTQIGVIDDIMAQGWCADGVDIAAPDGRKFAEFQTPRVGRPDVPGGGGMLRPVLARILREHVLASGTAVRCGTSFRSLETAGDSVVVRFLDGRQESYDLVVGADGLQSKVRQTIFPEVAEPRYTGQCCWRALVPRPPDVVRTSMALGAAVKAGYNPVSKDQMYLLVTERRDKPEFLDEPALVPELKRVLAQFGGRIGEFRDALNENSNIVFRPFYALLVPQPWHRGRIVLIGDAVHATTPHLASGAGIGVEDTIVLAEELERADDLESGLRAFTERRFERCRMVVENSVQLGEMERTGAPKQDHEQLMRTTMAALLAPI